MRDRVSFVLQQGRIRLVLTGALTPGHEIGDHHARHGDGVKVIALSVPDAGYAYRTAIERGAKPVREPHETSDEHGSVKLATIAAYGDTLHTFVERTGYKGAFLPGFVAEQRAGHGGDVGLLAIDHIVGNVELGHDGDVGQVLRGRLRHDGDAALLRRGHLDRVLRADVEGRHARATGGSSSRSTSRRRASASPRSTSTSSSTAARARSTSPSPRATSSRRSGCCASAASSS